MSKELVGEQGEQLLNNMTWKMLIDLALQYGWEPAGASAPDDLAEPIGEGEVEFVERSLGLDKLPSDHPLVVEWRNYMFESADPAIDSYFNNAGYLVTATDAQALADALERALPDVPAHDALGHKTVELKSAPGERLLPFGTPVNPFEWFSGKNRERLKDFITFCQKGGFEIW
jgi:hypothetical protein